MIYLFSKISDTQTNEIVDWLSYKKEAYIRINDEEATSAAYHHLYDAILKSAAGKSDIKNVFWFRRPDHKVLEKLSRRSLVDGDISHPVFPKDSEYFHSFKHNYKEYLRTYFHTVLDNSEAKIGSYYRTSLNKIATSDQAKKLGINIPPYIITNNKSYVEDFLNANNRNIICKTLSNGVYPIGVEEAGFLLRCLTTQITSTDVLPDEFFPSLFQKNIEKKFEIRTFFLDGKCYSAAMFTQLNDMTKVDFRNYDKDKATRIVPYQLDVELEKKISALMDAVGLDCGSLDIIKGLDNEYYFLEINPVGQFGWISAGCNYNFPKLIAEKLIEKKYGKNKN